MTFDEWCKQNPDSGRYGAWTDSAARFAPLVEACEELLDDYWCEIDAAGGKDIRRRTHDALKAVTDGV